MKVVCISPVLNEYCHIAPPVVGEVYEGNLVFFIDGKQGPLGVDYLGNEQKDKRESFQNSWPWEKNYLNLKGWSEMIWFETKDFMKLEEWREKQFKELGI